MRVDATISLVPDGKGSILVTAHRIVPDVERSAFVVLSMRSADDAG